jgi:copper(I)-binding protein
MTRAMAVVALVAALASGVAGATAPRIENAWMRPAAAGAASADAYADVITPSAVTLLRVRTPMARAVEIVVLDPKDAAAVPRVVDKLPIPAGETRFALRGSVLRLVDVRSALTPERPVPLTFEFTDYAGEKTIVEAQVQVRGILLPQVAPR